MLHTRFIIREMILAKKQALIFVLCTALSLTTFVASSDDVELEAITQLIAE